MGYLYAKDKSRQKLITRLIQNISYTWMLNAECLIENLFDLDWVCIFRYSTKGTGYERNDWQSGFH